MLSKFKNSEAEPMVKLARSRRGNHTIYIASVTPYRPSVTPVTDFVFCPNFVHLPFEIGVPTGHQYSQSIPLIITKKRYVKKTAS